MQLLIDNSNTRTKFALADGDTLAEWRTIIPTAELSPESISKALDGSAFTHATICSVVPDASKLLATFLGEIPLHCISHQSDLPISINYPNPAQIGADRLANSVAASDQHGSPAIVIDFGTAVTFDVIDKSGAYCGGAIAPGTASLKDYLHRRTALLPSIQLEEPTSAIGKSTEDAMQIGAVIGYRGLIREILEEMRQELGGEPYIIATGGDSPLISSGLKEIRILSPDLTLHGIRLIGQRNHDF